MYVVLKQKSVLLAIEMRLTSLAFTFLASATISRRTMCLWKLKRFKMADKTGVLSPDFQTSSLKWCDVVFDQSKKGIKTKIDI